MLPEPPKPLPPTRLDNLLPSLTESELRSPSSFPDQTSTDGSNSPTLQTPLAQRLRPTYQTQSNSFGLFRHYDKETLPTHDPEDISEDIAVSRPSATRAFVTMGHSQNVDNPFHPYPNEASFRLGDWYWNQGALKSKLDFKHLLGIIGSSSFRPDDIRNTKWSSIDHTLGTLASDDDSECSSEWLDSNAGWKRATVTISVPIPRRSTAPGPSDYRVSDFYYRPLVSVIREQVLDPNYHHLFHYEPYELLWRRSNIDIQVYGELYTSKTFLDAHHELLESPLEPGCALPRRIVALMFWSDATQLTSFGNAKLWPLYMFFGNQTKYKRAQPSGKLCSHVAYFQTVSMALQTPISLNELVH